MARIAQGTKPSVGIRDQYRKGLDDLIREMERSVLYWLGSVYRANEDTIVAADRSAARDLAKEINALSRQWEKRFGDYAEQRAEWLATRVNANTTAQMKRNLKQAGFTVQFKNSARVRRMLQSIVAENTSLIKSIASESMTQVTSIVFESVKNGRDMGFVTKQLREQFGVSKNRAITISRDQTNKATEAITVARCQDIGVTHGFWMHRGGSKVPRSTHQEFNGERFDLTKGLYDPQAEKKNGVYIGRWVKPAELINCHCTFKIDTSSIGQSGAAMDRKRGTMRIALPAADIEWSIAA